MERELTMDTEAIRRATITLAMSVCQHDEQFISWATKWLAGNASERDTEQEFIRQEPFSTRNGRIRNLATGIAGYHISANWAILELCAEVLEDVRVELKDYVFAEIARVRAEMKREGRR
jgi:hypothetical protein